MIASSSGILWDHVERATADVDLPVIVVAQRWSELDEGRALAAGAIGYLAFDLPAAVLDRSLRAALNGEVVFRRRTLGRWLRPGHVQVRRLPALSRRQREVATLIATGAPDKEIAVQLGIRVATVQKHVSKLLRVVGASNRAAAVWLVLGGTRLEI